MLGDLWKLMGLVERQNVSRSLWFHMKTPRYIYCTHIEIKYLAIYIYLFAGRSKFRLHR